MMESESDDAIVVARANLTAKLAELRRREAHVRTAVAPMRYLANPWLQVGIAALVGYRLGRPSRSSLPVECTARAETVTHAIVRAGVVALAQVLVRRAVAALVDERGDEP